MVEASDVRGPAPGRSRMVTAALVVLAMIAAGGGVYTWQRLQAGDRDDALATLTRERDEAVERATTLSADVAGLIDEVASLSESVSEKEREIERLRSGLREIRRCQAAPMLEAIREIPIAPPLAWAAVAVNECQNGYARVSAIPGNVPPGSSYDNEQVFLAWSGGAWEVLASGTGIGCSDADISPELRQACHALELL